MTFVRAQADTHHVSPDSPRAGGPRPQVRELGARADPIRGDQHRARNRLDVRIDQLPVRDARHENGAEKRRRVAEDAAADHERERCAELPGPSAQTRA